MRPCLVRQFDALLMDGGIEQLRYMKLDVRRSTCPGGGALWSLLSHVRELPAGDTIELLTDDYMANTDIPGWVTKRHWKVSRVSRDGYLKFTIERPGLGVDGRISHQSQK